MKKLNFNIDHKNFSFRCNGLDKHHVIKKINLCDLKARIVTRVENSHVEHKHVLLKDTPHYQFINGNKEPYRNYLKNFTWAVGFGRDHSEEIFLNLILRLDEYGYLSGPNNGDYIVCELINNEVVITDGLHRAVYLLSKGYDNVPVAFVNYSENQLMTYLKDYKDDFLEWYTPVKFENTIINERTYPNYVERPEFFYNKERGESRWNYIIEKNLPNIEGKKVCDVGCNIGLFSYYMLKLGAKLVDGFDRNENIYQPSNRELPKQNVVQQAYFVKNMHQLQDNKLYDRLQFKEFDILTESFENFEYDVFFSCCVLYHFGNLFEKFIEQISKNIPVIFLQTNLGHKGDLEKFASIEHHDYLLKKFGYKTKIDAPIGYKYPIIVGTK